MKRAAVCIGVAKTGGGLPTLKVARKGAEDMHAWALANSIDSHLITDTEGPVTVDQLRKKIKELIEPSNLDQLLVYFSGHGVNVRREEYWLLSGAPEDDEAVNLAGAEKRARDCGIPHVVFLSDACRTAPPDTQGQSIDADSIFPNLVSDGPEKKVDVFWACTLGKASHEIKDANDSAKRHAVYTDELLAALKGIYPEALSPEPPSMVLRPRPLEKLLNRKVPARIGELLGNAVPVSQTPDARITSDDDAWLARFDSLPEAPPSPVGGGLESFIPIAPPMLSIASVVRDAVRRAVSPAVPMNAALDELQNADVAGAKQIADVVQREAAVVGPDHFESKCGFKLRGALLRNVSAERAHVELLEPWLARVSPDRPAHNVLFELQDGRAFVLPAIAGFIATLSFEEGELRNVAYEPSANTDRWFDYVQKRDEITVLRSLIASSADVGGFRLDRDDAPQLTERIRFAKGIDPTMALYAAYSYYNLGKRDLIREMQQYIRDDMGVTFFDIAMLAGEKLVSHERGIFPFVPMLAQGWSLLDAFGINFPGDLSRLKRYVGMSLWTIFDEPAVPILRNAMRG